ncbi:hypothetical protein BWI17_13040 [Betaproteobacteria bacterium GR16-43]|nr:hypothetical protein BWI17_13040 [Betaproteobacteria bacterium GR16-43]
MPKKIQSAALACAALLLAGGTLAAPFTPGNVIVYRIGSGGAATLTANGNPVFLDEYTASGTLVQSVPLPSAAAGASKALIASGTATTDGHLARSADGTCIAVPGYGRDLGTGAGNVVSGTIVGGTPIPRVVARVTSAGTVDVTTALTDSAVADNFRSATSVDCSVFWVAGAAGGARYATRGATTSTQLTVVDGSNPSPRVAGIFAGQLYISAPNPQRGVAPVGTGLPTTGPAAYVRLPGLTNTNSTSPYGFFFADLDGTPGVDTLYIADDLGAALTKFSLVGGTWVSNGIVGVDADDYRFLTGVVSGTTVTLYAVRGGNQLVTLTDASGYNGAFAGTPTLLATAAANTTFRGVTLSPVLSATPLAGPGGSVSPATAQAVSPGGMAEFTIVADPSHDRVVTGTCGGGFVGSTNTYRTNAINASCTVDASFPSIVFRTVTFSSTTHGTVSADGPVQVQQGTTFSFSATPESGYKATVGGSCGVTPTGGNGYVTQPISADCTVAVSFDPLPTYAVTPSTNNAHGTLTPTGATLVLQGQALSFTVTPEAGYNAAVRGTCGGAWTNANTYVTAPILGPCTVQATFATRLVLFVGNSYTFGRVDPVMSYNAANVADLTHAMWLTNPTGSNSFEPHPWGGIPGAFKKMIDQAGLDWDVSISARNAASLRGHFLNSNPAGWDLRGNVASQPFDTVVLQELSDGALPDGRGANANLANFNTYADKLEKWVHFGAADPETGSPQPNVNARTTANVYLYQTWARPDMIAPNGTAGPFYTAAEGLELMTQHLHDAYFGRASSNLDFEAVSPVGDAFLRAVQEGFAMRDPYVPEPGKINLWFTEDNFHPSKHGSYLSALVHFATLTGLDPTTLGSGELAAADLGITPVEATELQLAARLAVLPKAPSIGVATPGPAAAIVSFTPPDNAGRLPILDYTVTCFQSQETHSATGTTSPIAVVGLNRFLGAQCSVAARNSVGSGTASSLSDSIFAGVGAHAAIGSFNLDGRDDIVWRHADGRVAIWLMDGLRLVAGAGIFPAGTGWRVVQVTNFDGDPGRADLLWQHTDGRIAIYAMDGLTALAKVNVAGPGTPTVTHAVHLKSSFFTGDLLLRANDGSLFAWVINPNTMMYDTKMQLDLGGEPGWRVAGTGKFSNLPMSSILLAHDDGRVMKWDMDEAFPLAKTNLLPAGTGWSVHRVADLDGDLNSDILWRHADGSVAAWRMNGNEIVEGATLLGPGTGWSITHTADFNGDGKDDLLWRHADGRVAIWLMNGITPIATTEILGPGTGWTVRNLLDFNGDGKRDILWVHTDGSVAIWLMNGTSVMDGATILGPGTGWDPVGVSPYF